MRVHGLFFIIFCAFSSCFLQKNVAAVQASEDRRFELMRLRDTLALANALHPRLYYLHSNGLAEDYDSHLKSVGSGAIQYARMEVLYRRIKRFGNWAHSSGQLRASGQYQMRDFDIKIGYSATYEKWKNGIWRLVYWQSTKIAD